MVQTVEKKTARIEVPVTVSDYYGWIQAAASAGQVIGDYVWRCMVVGRVAEEIAHMLMEAGNPDLSLLACEHQMLEVEVAFALGMKCAQYLSEREIREDIADFLAMRK